MNDYSIYDGAFSREGEFQRPDTKFREWIRADGSTRFAPEKGRYHLYLSLACPWSHRVAIARRALGLEGVIGLSVCEPVWGERGWTYGREIEPGVRDILDLYRKADPGFADEETVPVLWDRRLGTVVNNESREILRMMDVEFAAFAKPGATLLPPGSADEVDRVIDAIYQPVNNGVYRCGFARSQRAYDRALGQLFEALDRWETVLGRQRYLCGDRITEADVAMYVTLCRFDPVYVTHFKTNLRRIADYPSLWGYVRDLYQTEGFGETTDFDQIKRHYFGSHQDLNPYGIIPPGPLLDFRAPHSRSRTGAGPA